MIHLPFWWNGTFNHGLGTWMLLTLVSALLWCLMYFINFKKCIEWSESSPNPLIWFLSLRYGSFQNKSFWLFRSKYFLVWVRNISLVEKTLLLCDVLLLLMLNPIFQKISIYTHRDICYCPSVEVSCDIYIWSLLFIFIDILGSAHECWVNSW